MTIQNCLSKVKRMHGVEFDLKKEIKELSMSIAYLLDEPSEVTQQDLYNLQDIVTKLENEVE